MNQVENVKWVIGKLYLLAFAIMLQLPFSGYSQKSAKKMLRYHSGVFKDTASLCSGARYEAYNYIMNSKKINHLKSDWIETYLGVDSKWEESGITTYRYAISCLCDEAQIEWPLCTYVLILVKDNKVIRTSLKEYNWGSVPIPIAIGMHLFLTLGFGFPKQIASFPQKSGTGFEKNTKMKVAIYPDDKCRDFKTPE